MEGKTLEEILIEKGFTKEQIKKVMEALEDDRYCHLCYGSAPCYCAPCYDE